MVKSFFYLGLVQLLCIAILSNTACALIEGKQKTLVLKSNSMWTRIDSKCSTCLGAHSRSNSHCLIRSSKLLNLRGGYYTDLMPFHAMILLFPLLFTCHAILSLSVVISIPISIYLYYYSQKLVAFVQDLAKSREGCIKILIASHAFIFLTLLSSGKLASLRHWVKYFVFTVVTILGPTWWILNSEFPRDIEDENWEAVETKNGNALVWRTSLAFLVGAIGSVASLHSASLKPPPPPLRSGQAEPPTRLAEPPIRLAEPPIRLAAPTPDLYGPPLGEVYGTHINREQDSNRPSRAL